MSTKFRTDFGMWWPDYDHNPAANFRQILHGLRAAHGLGYACHSKRRRQCIQAGGHVGIWPRHLARFFKQVFTFEAEPALAECLRKNLADVRGVKVVEAALGPRPGVVMMRPTSTAGTWRVDAEEGRVPVNQVTIDSLGLTEVDAIALDVEGYEVPVLRGARETINRTRPAILLEMLPRSTDEIRAHMNAIGYEPLRRYGRDNIFFPRKGPKQ